MREILSKLAKKHKDERHSGVCIVNFKHISSFGLVFPLLNLNNYMPAEIAILLLPSNIFLPTGMPEMVM